MNTVRWILPLAGAGMLAAVSIAGLERTDEILEPASDGQVQASWQEEDERPVAVVVPAGTPLAVILQSALSTRTAEAGERFVALVAAPVRVHGRVVIPRGAEIEGHVAMSEPPGEGPRPGRLQLTYERVRFDGAAYGLNSRSQVYEGAASPRSTIARMGPDMRIDPGATLEFELAQAVAVMTGGPAS
jgi:hypothetical protein